MISEQEYGFPDDPNEIVRALSRYLARSKGGSDFPQPAAIRPEDLPPAALPNLIIVDVEGDSGPLSKGPWRFRFRLVGENIRAAAGTRWAGRYLDRELVGDKLAIFLNAYEMPLRTRRPSVADHTFVNFETKGTYPSRRFLFPLSPDNRIITRLLGFQFIETGAWRSGLNNF